MSVVAQFSDVVKEYPARGGLIRAVDGVTFAVEAGEVLGLIGPNRSGKSTLARLLVSLARPSAGTVTRFGRPSDDWKTLGMVGYVPEAPTFPGSRTAADLLLFHASLAGIRRADRLPRVRRWLDRVGLGEGARESIAGFSKGMRARLALAQALVHQPELLVLDEPAGGLDGSGRAMLLDVIREHRGAGGSTLLITHGMADVDRCCDRIAALSGGRLDALGGACDRIGSRARTLGVSAHPPLEAPVP